MSPMGPTACAAMFLLIAPIGQVMAQEESKVEPSLVLEEIIVTARKISESIQSTPVAITALTTLGLERRNIESLSDLTGYVPNLVIDGSSGTAGSDFMASVTIRGMGQIDDQIAADPAVGIFIDGVYYARSAGGVMEVVDLERIEVIRGPQGTVFGKNTMGGAISLISLPPGDAFGGYAKVELGDYSAKAVRGSVDVPIVEDKLFARFSVARRERDGYGERLIDSAELGNVDSTVGRASLRWLTSDTIAMTTTADYTYKREDAGFQKTVAITGAAGAALYNQFVIPGLVSDGVVEPGFQLDESALISDPYTTNSGDPSKNDLDSWGISHTVDWHINDHLDFASITAYREMESAIGGDGDGTPVVFYGLTLSEEQEQFSQEFRLSGLAFDDKLNWLTGLYYFEEDVSSFNPLKFFSGLYPALENLPFGIDLSGGAGYFVVGCPEPYTAPDCGNPTNQTFNLETDFNNRVENESWAIFGQINYEVTDRLNISVGTRYSHDEKVFSIDSFNIYDGVYVLPPGTSKSGDWAELTSKLSFDYALTPDAILYASISEGFKGGGFNIRAGSIEEISEYAPETVIAYEMGIKSKWLDNRIRLNTAIFYNDYEDLQLSYNVPSAYDILVVVGNVASASVKGFEMELDAILTENLLINLGVGYLDDQIEEIDPDLADDVNRVTRLPIISKATQIPKTPEWSSSLGVQYTVPFNNGSELLFRGDYRYTSEYYHRYDNGERVGPGKRDDLSLLSGQIVYTPAEANWQVTLAGTNLTGELYSTGGTDGAVPGGIGISTASYAAPRMWTIAFQYNFGESR